MNTLKTKLIGITKDPVMFGTIIVTFGILLNAVFSYLLQFLLGRLLSVDDYGTFNALLSLSYIINVPATVLGLSLIKVVSDLKAKNEFEKLTRLFWNLSGIALLLGLLPMLLVIVTKDILAAYLNLKEPNVLLPFSILLLVSFLYTVPSSYLQGLLRFKAFAANLIALGFIRFLVPLILVLAGLRVGGIYFGISFAFFYFYVSSVLLLRKNFVKNSNTKLNDYYKKLILFSGPVLLVNLGMMMLNNVDVIMVKRYFDDFTAGYYAGIVTIGKILLFGAGTVGIVMFPQISESFAKKENFMGKFNKLLIIQIILVVVGVAVFSLFSKPLVTLMFGPKFISAVPYVPSFSIFMGLYVLTNYFVTFFLAIEKTRVFLFQIPAVILQFCLLNIFNDSIDKVIGINILITSGLLLFLIIYFLKYLQTSKATVN